jgi:hypothetical protein
MRKRYQQWSLKIRIKIIQEILTANIISLPGTCSIPTSAGRRPLEQSIFLEQQDLRCRICAVWLLRKKGKRGILK